LLPGINSGLLPPGIDCPRCCTFNHSRRAVCRNCNAPLRVDPPLDQANAVLIAADLDQMDEAALEKYIASAAVAFAGVQWLLGLGENAPLNMAARRYAELKGWPTPWRSKTS
jgi:hypothetical protein